MLILYMCLPVETRGLFLFLWRDHLSIWPQPGVDYKTYYLNVCGHFIHTLQEVKFAQTMGVNIITSSSEVRITRGGQTTRSNAFFTHKGSQPWHRYTALHDIKEDRSSSMILSDNSDLKKCVCVLWGTGDQLLNTIKQLLDVHIKEAHKVQFKEI